MTTTHAPLRTPQSRPRVANAAIFMLLILTGCGKTVHTGAFPLIVEVPQKEQEAHPQYTPRIETFPLQDEYGIDRKIIINKPNIRCRESFHSESPVGEPLTWFHPYFLVDTFPNAPGVEPSMYKISMTPNDNASLGWVSVDDAIEWRTRMAARWSKNTPLVVASTFESLETSIRAERPIADPIARFEGNSTDAWMPWPILESKVIQHLDRHYECVRLAFLAQPSARAKQRYSEREVEGFKDRLRTLSVVFVVDNTLSTEPQVEAMIEALTGIVDQLKNMPDAPKLRCSVVLFRDYVNGLYFEESGTRRVVRVFETTDNLESLISELRQIEAPKQDSLDLPESVYDGVDAGLELLDTEDKLAMKVLVLCGDNSAHDPGSRGNPRNIAAADLIERACEQKTTLYSLCVAGGGSEAERNLHRRQFEHLARGTKGECYSLAESSKIVAAIEQLIQNADRESKQRREELNKLARRTAADAKPSPATLAAPLRSETVVMELLRDANIDPERLHADSGPADSTIQTTGWVIASIDGQPVIDQCVFLTRSDLNFVLAELNSLCAVLSAKNGERIHEIIVNIKTGDFLRHASSKQTFDSFMRARGIPARTGLLRLSKEEIVEMPEEIRSSLSNRLQVDFITALTLARNDNRVFRLHGSYEYGFINARFFP